MTRKRKANIAYLNRYKGQRRMRKITQSFLRYIKNKLWYLLIILTVIFSYGIASVLLSEQNSFTLPWKQVAVVTGGGNFELKDINPQVRMRSLKAPRVLKIIKARVRYIVDGDSIYLKGYKPQIRLWGVDAPERGKYGYQAATRYLKKIAKARILTCEMVDKDRYGRTVARCFLSNGKEINRMMIESGTAQEYTRFSKGFYKKSQR